MTITLTLAQMACAISGIALLACWAFDTAADWIGVLIAVFLFVFGVSLTATLWQFLI